MDTEAAAARHVILLGDSIFDNGVYVPGEPDVVTQLRTYLPEGCRATRLAVDGDYVEDVHHQLARLPPDATQLVLSAGGNDALQHVGILERGADSTLEVLQQLHDIRAAFALRYRELLDAVLTRNLATAVCTIYEGNLEAEIRQPASIALSVFNDVILRVAFEAGVAVIDLRLVCASPECYANPIEPSAIGGDRIARAIAEMVTSPDSAHGRTRVFGSAARAPGGPYDGG